MIHLIRDIYLITQVEGENPPGILIIAPPGTGKSFVLSSINYSKNIITNDITEGGLQKLLVEINKQGQGYLVIPDLLKVLARPNGGEAFVTLANVLLEEGVQRSTKFNLDIKFDKPLNFGMAEAITDDVFTKQQKMLEEKGFLSRHFLSGFSYCDEDIPKIKKSISRDEKFPPLEILVRPSTSIKIPEKYLKWIDTMGTILGYLKEDRQPYLRAIKQVRALFKAEAWANDRVTVEEVDINNVYCLLPFFVTLKLLKADKYSKETKRDCSLATDAEYCLLRSLLMCEPYPYSDKTKEWAMKRLIEMDLADFSRGRFEISRKFRKD